MAPWQWAFLLSGLCVFAPWREPPPEKGKLISRKGAKAQSDAIYFSKTICLSNRVVGKGKT
jgi:hypothetical protein